MGPKKTTHFWDNLAVDAYQSLLSNQPNNPLLLNNLGLAYRRLGRHKKAIAAFRKTIRSEKQHCDAHYHLAVTLEESGESDAAKSCFMKYQKLRKQEGISFKCK